MTERITFEGNATVDGKTYYAALREIERLRGLLSRCLTDEFGVSSKALRQDIDAALAGTAPQPEAVLVVKQCDCGDPDCDREYYEQVTANPTTVCPECGCVFGAHRDHCSRATAQQGEAQCQKP